MIELPSEEMDAYLEMTRIAAVWVAAPAWGTPVHTGATSSLLRVDFSRLEAGGRLHFEWVAWVEALTLAEWLSWAPFKLFTSPQKRVAGSATVGMVVEEIKAAAEHKAIKLGENAVVMERTRATVRRINLALKELQALGQLADFNSAYKRNRVELKLPSYETVHSQLRKLVAARVLCGTDQNISELADEMRRRFPWMQENR